MLTVGITIRWGDCHPFALNDEINMELGDTIDIIVEGCQTFTVIGFANSPLIVLRQSRLDSSSR